MMISDKSSSPGQVVFFRGVGDWTPDYGVGADIVNTILADNPSIGPDAPYLMDTTCHTAWDKEESFGWVFDIWRRKKLRAAVSDEISRDERQRRGHSEITRNENMRLVDGLKDVADYLFKGGVAGAYSQQVHDLAASHARLIKGTGPMHSPLIVMGHSLGTVGAVMYCHYLMNQFTTSQWHDYNLQNHTHLILVSPAVGFPSVRNKMARYLPKTYDPAVSLASARGVMGTSDFMLRIPSYDVQRYNLWTPSLLAKEHSLRWVAGMGHSFPALIELRNRGIWVL